MEAPVFIGLLHYPVFNKRGNTIASAITNFDIHDVARVSRTYGVERFYIINPFHDQKRLAQRILDHWLTGYGSVYNPLRAEALTLVDVATSVEDAICDIEDRWGHRPKIMVTDARVHRNSIGYFEAREMLMNGCAYLILFGIAWGIATDIIEKADYILAPIRGNSDYNHLSVRSAVAIIMDRLLGDRR